MLAILIFLFLSSANVLLIIKIIRSRGIASVEGIGLIFLLLYLLSFAVPSLLAAITSFRQDEIDLIDQVFEDAAWPLLVHFVGLLAFFSGLSMAKIGPDDLLRENQPISSDLSHYIIGLLFVGLGMKVLALYLGGFENIFSYLDNLYDYDISARTYGLLDLGTNIALFGCCIATIHFQRNAAAQLFWVLTGVLLGLLLSTSKSGILHMLLPLFFLAKLMSPLTISRFTRWYVVLPGIAIFLATLGLKGQVKYLGFEGVDWSPLVIIEFAWFVLTQRVSASGLFSGFVNLVNRVTENSSLQLGGAALEGTFSGVIPRFVWVNFFDMEKPDHPFRGLGELLHPEFLVDMNATDAPLFVGYAFIDFGWISLIAYSLVGGMILGYSRKLASLIGGNRVLFAYVIFAVGFGPSMAEGGFLNMLYYLGLGFIVYLICLLSEYLVRFFVSPKVSWKS